MNTVTTICENPSCQCKFEKPKAEYNRNKKIGRRNFCSRKCSGQVVCREAYASQSLEIKKSSTDRIKGLCGNRRDTLTSFRFFTHVIKNNRKKKLSVDETYLKKIWDDQKGICPLTGWNLELPYNTSGWKTPQDARRASLDRIDNNKGYVEGNVRFISVMANYARNNMSDNELIEFCKAVVEKNMVGG